jgi:hypothetical protein
MAGLGHGNEKSLCEPEPRAVNVCRPEYTDQPFK